MTRKTIIKYFHKKTFTIRYEKIILQNTKQVGTSFISTFIIQNLYQKYGKNTDVYMIGDLFYFVPFYKSYTD